MVEFNVPVTAEVAFEPSGVIVVELSVPVTDELALVPEGVNVCVCVPRAEPANVGCVNVPAPIVGTPAGQLIVGCVNVPEAMLGTPAGHATVPDGVKLAVLFVPAGVSVCV